MQATVIFRELDRERPLRYTYGSLIKLDALLKADGMPTILKADFWDELQRDTSPYRLTVLIWAAIIPDAPEVTVDQVSEWLTIIPPQGVLALIDELFNRFHGVEKTDAPLTPSQAKPELVKA